MSINCTLQINNETHTLDLSDYLGKFNDFVDDIYEVFGLESPVNVSDIKIVDTEYFNSFSDLEQFISINFGYGYIPKTYLAWIYHTGNAFNNYSKFQDQFKGLFHTTNQFCIQFAERYAPTKNLPTYVTECIDYEKMWNEHLSKQFYTLKVEDDSVDNVTTYIYAVFSNV